MRLSTLFYCVVVSLFSCKETNKPPVSLATSVIPATSTIACNDLLTSSMVEQSCHMKGIVERITSVEQAGRNCIRSYRLGKGWGDDLIFIVTQTPGQADLSYIKKAYADKGLKTVSGIGEEAYTMDFTDKLTGRQEHQLVFLKKNLFIELKTKESANTKTLCPCYSMNSLKKLAIAIAAKIN